MDVLSIILFIVVLLVMAYVLTKLTKTENRIDEINKKVDDFQMEMSALIEGAVAKTFQNSADVLKSLFASAITENSNIIKGAFATSLKELGIQEDLGKLSEASNDLKRITSDLKSMFQVKQSRAKFGELQLETLLKDIFPSSRLHFQKNIGSGTPDACIVVEDSIYLCIDSKFPLENFKRYSEAESESDKKNYWKEFVNDVRNHVKSIKTKYVGKENTLNFALMFVPSDTIFYHLISESPDIVVDAAKLGVVLTSPSTLPAYLSLVSARIQAQEISKRAEDIQKKLVMMGEYIEDLGRNLNTLFGHVNRASNKIHDVKSSFDKLRNFHIAVSGFEEVEWEG
ncbi:DNA recombination protein RmuC [Thermococcus sp. MV5]|nr:DNA recombination protein RmuC [Thermococcus sp. MV5]